MYHVITIKNYVIDFLYVNITLHTNFDDILAKNKMCSDSNVVTLIPVLFTQKRCYFSKKQHSKKMKKLSTYF